MIAAACGGSGSDGATGTTSPETEEVVEDIEDNEATGEDTREDAGEAVRGGRLVYGIEAGSTEAQVALENNMASGRVNADTGELVATL